MKISRTTTNQQGQQVTEQATVMRSMKGWAVTLQTGENLWSTIEVEAEDHVEAVERARALLGEYPCTDVQ